MNPADFKNSRAGRCIKTPENYWAFVPNDLPPVIKYDKTLTNSLSRADRALSELSGAGKRNPNPYLLVSPYMRKEAVSSSRIEGTQATIQELFYYESSSFAKETGSDVMEVANYVKAIEFGINALEKLPISIRLIKNIHKILMEGVRGNRAMPGELRKSQNWIGTPNSSIDNVTYVPPPVDAMKESLYRFEKYLHVNSDDPLLIRCALIHYQLEAIHPFLDGNGRIGRLLITFFLIEKNYLSQPLLYLSEYFERHREQYYTCLLNISRKGDWTAWLLFFLKGIEVQSKDAIEKADNILELYSNYAQRLRKTKKIPESSQLLLDEIFLNPFVSTSRLSKKWNLPYNSVKTGIKRLEKLNILAKIPDNMLERFDIPKRYNIYVAPDILNLDSS